MTTASRAFELADPADAQRFWFLDLIHSPRALPPLSADLTVAMSDFTPVGLEGRIINDYCYFSPRSMTPPPPMPELPPGAALHNWQTKYLPETRAEYELLRDKDYKSMTAPELVAFLWERLPITSRVFANTIVSAMEIGPESRIMGELLEAKLGAEGDLLSATVLHGGGSETRAIGDDVHGLAELARKSTGVAEMLKAREFGAALESTAEPWASALRAFIDDHADELGLWSELQDPAWNEDPLPLLRMVASTLEAPAANRRDAGAAATAEVRARLSGADLEEFEEAFATSRNYVTVIEHRARWQLKLFGGFRRALVALGEKLVAMGKLESANDVFFLHLDELRPAAEGEIDGRPLVIERRAAWQDNLALNPPMMVGMPVPFEMLGAMNPMLRRMFGAVALAAPTETLVSGIGASSGVVRGRARVVDSLYDADALEEGDILVCPSTSPPWTPYLAVVAAVVTDAGGMMSHAAIEAREYGIPAVVGTREGTARIPDGAMITVDGTAGTITIER